MLGQVYDMLCAVDQSVQALEWYICACAGLEYGPDEQLVYWKI